MTEKQSKTPPQLADELARATRALTRAGFTLVEGAQEWKPPLGPSASPLLDRIDRLAELLNEAKDSVWYHADHHGSEDAEDLMARINAALAGNLPERLDTEWTDAASTPTSGDYRELQAQHDQLQSKYKAAMDMLREAAWQVSQYAPGSANLLQRIDALLDGQVPAQAVNSHPMQPILLDPAGCPRFKKNSAVEYLAEGRLNEIASRGYSAEDMTQLAQLIGYSVAGFSDLSYVSDADYERAVAAAPKPEGAA